VRGRKEEFMEYKKDNPRYYSNKLAKLLEEAKDNNLTLSADKEFCDKMTIFFENGTDKCGVILYGEFH
jgi:hypothetical protein